MSGIKVKAVYENTAEKLLGGKRGNAERIQYFLGLALWNRYDKLLFQNLPYWNIREDYNKAYVNEAGKEVATLEFQFYNLKEALGQMSKIVIFHEKTTFNSEPPSVNIDLKTLQRKKILAELPVLSVDEELFYEQEIVLPEPKTYYNFWAVYIDSAGRPATYKGVPIINYIYRYPVNGVYEASGLIEAKNLRCLELEDVQDLDGQGYGQIQHLTKDTVTLEWTDITSFQSEGQFKNNLGDPAYMRDTFGHRVHVKYEDIKKFEYYVVYKYTSENGKKPINKYPLQLDYKIGRSPMVKDANGKWEYLLTTKENLATIKLNPGEIVAFWVGMKFRDA